MIPWGYMATERELTAVLKARDEMSSAVKSAQSSLGGLGDVAATVGKAVVGFGLAAGAAAVGFAATSIKKYSEVGDAVEKMATRTGLSAESISALRVAADMGGTSIEAVENATKKFTVQLGQAQAAYASSADLLDAYGLTLDELGEITQQSIDGNAKATNQLKEMGLSIEDVGKVMGDIYGPFTSVGLLMEDMANKTLDEKLVMVGNALAAIQDPAERTTAAVEIFGKAGTDLIPMFEGGNFSMEAFSEQAKKLGVSFDDLSAKKAADLNDSIGAMGIAWNGLMLKVGGELAPVLTKFISETLVPLAEKVLAVVPTLSETITWLTNLKNTFVDAANEFDAKTGILTALKEAFDRIWALIQDPLIPAITKLVESMKPLEPMFAAIGKVVGSVLVVVLRILIEVISFLIERSIVVISTFTEIAATIFDVLQPAFEFITTAIGKVGDALSWAVNKFNDMKNAAIDAFNAAKNAIGSVPGVSAVVGAFSGRALGGPVYAGTPYTVGENGPETFVPNQSGTIVPRVAAGGGGGGVTINLSVGTMMGGNPAQIASDIGDMIIKKLQMNART